MVPPATSDASRSSGDRSVDRWLPGSRDTVLLVAGITLLALLVRFVLLGDRVAHWDEGRVAYWINYYQQTGSFAYRRIIHGPFVQHANRWIFSLFGANDFTMRLPVAIVGGLLPLSALLFREHLRRAEMAAMALFLALNPVLLYYSRFMRSDVLVAAFMFVAFGFLVRFYDTRRTGYLYGAAVFVAFGFASKENALIYVLTWIGAAGLLADQALYRPRDYDSGFELLAAKARGYWGRFSPSRSDGGQPAPQDDWRSSVPRGRGADAVATLFSYLIELGALLFVFFVVLLFFYAPRGAGIEGLQHPPADAGAGAVGLWESFRSPSAFFGMVDSTWTYASEEFSSWITQSTEAGDEGLASVYAGFLGQFLTTMWEKAAPMTAFAVFGFALERYGATESRNLVMFAAYGGFVSVLGYPLGTDVYGGWLVVHALVPLSIPAAVGLARVFDWGYDAFTHDDSVDVGIAALLLLLVAGSVVATAVPSVYINDQARENSLVQYAQPGGDPRPELQEMAAIGQENRTGDDVVLYYGERGDDYDESLAFVESNRDNWDEARLNWQPTCTNWFNSLPLPWYFAKTDADVSCADDSGNLTQRIESNPPPMIITQDADSTVPTGALESAYEGESYEMRTYGKETTFWVLENRTNETG